MNLNRIINVLGREVTIPRWVGFVASALLIAVAISANALHLDHIAGLNPLVIEWVLFVSAVATASTHMTPEQRLEARKFNGC